MHTGLHYTCMLHVQGVEHAYRPVLRIHVQGVEHAYRPALHVHVHVQGVDWWSFGTLVFEMLTGMLSPAPA